MVTNWKVGSRRVLAAAALAAAIAGTAWAGDWPQYRHDVQGTSNANEALTVSQGRSFNVKWTYGNGAPIANPVVANGTVYVLTSSGVLRALDAATGQQRWSRNATTSGTYTCNGMQVGSGTVGAVGAPAVVGNRVFFPNADGVVYALDAATGSTIWSTPVANVFSGAEFFWSSAFVVGSKVYVSIGTRFEDVCGEAPGRVVALDQATGQVTGTWWATSTHTGGGGIWTQPVFDSETGRIFVATGNVQKGVTPSSQPWAQAIVAIDPATMTTVDSIQNVSTDFYVDNDYGASPTIYDLNGHRFIAAVNKNGHVYGFYRDNLRGGVVWDYQVSGPGASPDLGEGSICSPAYANGTLFVGGGATPDGHPGKIAALDAATGVEKWHYYPNGFVLPAIAAAGDVIFVGLSNKDTHQGSLLVLSQATGELLFHDDLAANIFAAPTYANGTLYFGDVSASLWALTPATAGTTTTGGTTGGTTTGGTTTGGSTGGTTGGGFINPVVTANPGFTSSTAPFAVELDATRSTTTDTNNDWITSYHWQLSDGATSNNGWIDHTFTSPGTYTGTVTLTDVQGHTATKTVTVQVGSGGSSGGTSGGTTGGGSFINPVVTANPGFTSSTAPFWVELDSTLSTTSDPNNDWITGFHWQLSDGATSNNGWIDHTFASPGTYTATVTITDVQGHTATKSVTVQVGSGGGSTGGTTGGGGFINPVVTANPGFSGRAPFSLELDSTLSTTTDTNNDWITGYHWQLSDGATSNLGWIDHTFANPGTYTGTVTLTDVQGHTATKTVTVQVNP